MITRANVLSQISALLDDELPEKDALAIKKHLLSCNRCRAEFEKLKKIDRLLNEWDRQVTKCIKTSDTYSERLCRRIRAMKNRKLPSRHKQMTNHPGANLRLSNPASVISHTAILPPRFGHSYNLWKQRKDFPHLTILL